MQCLQQQNEWRQLPSERAIGQETKKLRAPREASTPKSRLPVSDGFRDRYAFFCDGVRCVGAELMSKQLVRTDPRIALATARSTTAATAGEKRVEKIGRDPRHFAFVQTQKQSFRQGGGDHETVRNTMFSCASEESENVGMRHATKPSSENTCSHFRKDGGLGRCAHKILEPILQEMVVKEQERREAHLHETTIAAICD